MFDSTLSVPTVSDRVKDALFAIGTSPEQSPNLNDLLFLSLFKVHGWDKDGSRARAWDAEIVDRLNHIVDSITLAKGLWLKKAPPSEVLLCAIAMRDLPQEGLKGVTIAKKNKAGADFIGRVEGVYRPFKRVLGAPASTNNIHAYAQLGLASRYLLEIHAINFTTRVLKKLTDSDNSLSNQHKSILLANIAPLRFILGKEQTRLAKRFKKLLTELDTVLERHASGSASGATVIHVNQNRFTAGKPKNCIS